MNQKKTAIIFGGVALAAGALWYIRHKQKQEAEAQKPSGLESAIVAPSTHYAVPYEGGGGGFGGGGAPSSSGPEGVLTAPEPEHNNVTTCGPGEHAVGVSAIRGGPSGIKCIKETRNGDNLTTDPSKVNCHTIGGRVFCA